MDTHEVAVIVGAGPGLGYAIGRRCARAEMHVALAARDMGRLETLATECSGVHHHGRAYTCDTTSETEVEAMFDLVGIELGIPSLVVYNAGTFIPRGLLDTTAAEFNACWQTNCLGGFLVGRAAARRMLARSEGRRGTIVFTGATASLRGSAGFHNLAVGKFGLRALAQSMAREFQPHGLHVAHVVIDGQIRPPGATPGDDSLLDPDAIADTYYRLHCQPPSAWTQELDLRPWKERF